MEIAWLADRQPATLWSLTPDTADGLLALADFALGARPERPRGSGLRLQLWSNPGGWRCIGPALSACAGSRLWRPTRWARAENSAGARLLMVQAVLQSGQHLPALRLAEHIWRGSHLARSIENAILDVDPGMPMAQGGMTIWQLA